VILEQYSPDGEEADERHQVEQILVGIFGPNLLVA
jgi:hypothetical protein